MNPEDDPKASTTFKLVHRAQNDPLIHDATASSMVFAEKDAPQASKSSRKVKQRGDLEEEFGLSIRSNEGEAAQHGVFYDDTEYDYMQHMRDLGEGGGMFVEAGEYVVQKGRGKGKQKLEDALKDMDLGSETKSTAASAMSTASKASSLLPEEMLPSEFVRKTTYQDQQDVPDVLAGFQPDMDQRLREVLEALEDEAYVEDEEGFFEDLAADGEEMDQLEWETTPWEDEKVPELVPSRGVEEDDGWESDDTIKADEGSNKTTISLADIQALEVEPPADPVSTAPPDAPMNEDGDWMAEFSKFKGGTKPSKAHQASPSLPPSDIQSILTGTSGLPGYKRKKRKGAKTSSDTYSMTSSALHRTEGQTLLDERFDKIEEEYADDGYDADDTVSLASGATGITGISKMSGLSKMSATSTTSGVSCVSGRLDEPKSMRSDFGSIIDDFSNQYSKTGNSRRMKKGACQTGMQQLDEIRNGLGPARLKTT
ncbi:MAG: hypothetical protein Q9157_003884 [Trypethelium eluteriae]